MPLRKRPKAEVPLTALGRPWRSAVEPGLRTGLFDDPDSVAAGPPDEADADEARAEADRAALDPEIASDLDDLADAVEALTPDDMSRLHAFWRNVPDAARMRAYDHAQAAAIRTGRRAAIRRFEEELLAWSRAATDMPATMSRLYLPIDNGLPRAFGKRPEVRPALNDTMVALALQDELDDRDFEALFGPWRDAMGDAPADA